MDLASDSGVDGGALKKGPWTAAEDTILVSYVTKHGEGNWNSVQKHSGLFRCGKSCRLRWANHLRPNLKKGAFSPDEEHTIVDLHAKFGNKWARMAAQIKNYWNTRIKRRMRAGLPVYPAEKLKSCPAQYLVDVSERRNLISARDSDCDFASSLTQQGDHQQALHMNSIQEHCQLRSYFSVKSLSDLPISSVAIQGTNSLKGLGCSLLHTEQIGPSQYGGSVVGNGSVSISQLSDGSSKSIQPPYNKTSQACTLNIMWRPHLAGFGNEDGLNMIHYNVMPNYGTPSLPYNPESNASLRLELPLSQSAESADSAGTQRSSITNPSPLMSLALTNHVMSEAESYGSNASNFLEALMQEAHPTEGLDQVRTDLIDQLFVLTSGNMPPDVAALLMSPQKGRWGEDSDPTTPLGGRAFSDFSDEVSPMCKPGSWEEPQPCTMQSLPPAPIMVIPRVEGIATDLVHAPLQQSCTDEDFLTILDFASTEIVPEWYTPPEYYPGGVVPRTPLADCLDAGFNHQIAVLESQGTGQSVSNHTWELGSCPWNASSVGCDLGDFSSVDYRSQNCLGEQKIDNCATC